MKRKPNPEKADIENPAWTKATFACARAADAVLPETFGEATALRRSRTSASSRKPPDRRGARLDQAGQPPSVPSAHASARFALLRAFAMPV